MNDRPYDDWLAARYPGSGSVDDRVRLGRRRRVLVLAVTLVVVTPAAVYAAVRFGGSVARAEPAPWATWLGLGLSLVGLAFQITALVRAFRSGVVRANRGSRLWALTSRQRRRVLQQVRGRRPVAPDEVAFARDVAETLRSQGWLLQVAVGLMLIQGGQALQHAGLPRVAFAIVAVGMVGAGLLLLRDQRLERRFLERTAQVNGTHTGDPHERAQEEAGP